MAFSGTTPNLKLPQYANTDQPKYIPDFNSAMSAIDTGYANNLKKIETNTGFINTLTTNLNTTNEQLSDVNTLATNATNKLADIALADKTFTGNLGNATVKAGGTGSCFYISIKGRVANLYDLATICTLDNYSAPFAVGASGFYAPITVPEGTLENAKWKSFPAIILVGGVVMEDSMPHSLPAPSGPDVPEDTGGPYDIIINFILPFNPFTA